MLGEFYNARSWQFKALTYSEDLGMVIISLSWIVKI